MQLSLKRLRQKFGEHWKKNGRFRLILKSIFFLFAAGAAAVLLLVFSVWAGLFGKLPDKNTLSHIDNPLASEVYSADSVLLGRYYIQERSFLKSNEIPDRLKKTLVSTEDVRFYRHSGIDYKSLGRVLVKSILLQKESSGGGSTITQQLAKNLYPRKEVGLLSLPVNKVREFIIARRLERIYSKDEILVLYLNTIPFADNTFGIKTAADRFFSCKVSELTWEQSAVLVGMLKATHYYNPRLFPERALERRNVVLSQLDRYGHLPEIEVHTLQKRPLGLRYNPTTHHTGLAPYFRAFVQQQLLAWCRDHKKADGSPYNLYADGLKVYTTIDSRLQTHAEDAMREKMAILQKRFHGEVSNRQLAGIAKGKLKDLPQYQVWKNEGYSEAQIMQRLKDPVKTRVFSWEGEKETEISLYDSMLHHLRFLQAGVMAMDPHSGAVKVYVGGIDHRYFQFDHVRESTRRQIGSTFKPIVYAAALEKGISPCDYVPARKTVYTNMDDWAPENSDDETYDRKYSMQGGLAGSVNTVSVSLIEKTGIENTIAIARKMGIESTLPAVPSIALGTPSISVTEMVEAYAVFANGGMHVEPHYISAITDKDGRVLEEFKSPPKKRAVSEATANLMIHMMKSVVSEGTASSLRTRYGLQNDLAGKTGTTQSNVDGWFIAASPKLVVGTWVGADDPRMHFRSTALGQGAATALPIVAAFFRNVNRDPKLHSIAHARFAALPASLAEKLNCAPSRSNLNILEKIFKKKKKVKTRKFKGGRKSSDP